ncbi:MAG: N-acetylmannosaminyltransferase [Candidatus Rifleibacterium amylolyticum]|nr:MAG: N-acetylmannosaminyltransferase [Candidatus Rifleibacterium amylolyticum]
MNYFTGQIEPLITATAGAILFWALGRRLTAHVNFELGRGNYVGAFPFLGALLGAGLAGGVFAQQSFLALTAAACLLSLIGFLRDRQRLSYLSLLPWCALTIIACLFAATDTGGLFVISATAWALLIIFSLKIAALVYEMPFILLTTSTLTQFILFSQHQFTPTAVLANLSLLIASVLMLFYSTGGRRLLTGSSGIFAAGFLLAAISLLEGSGRLLIFGIFVPSMVILFPFALISAMIVASYFGNRLHQGISHERHYSWSLRRERTVLFAGLFFLCLNFLALLVIIDAPGPAYVVLFLLFIFSLFVFVSTFARKESVPIAPVPAKIDILGITIDAVLPADVIARIEQYLRLSSVSPDTPPANASGNNGATLFHIVTADSLALVRAGEDERFRNSMRRAALVLPDGAGVVWAADFLGTPLPGRVPGVALVSQICETAGKAGWKVFFLGGKPGIAKQAAGLLQKEHGITICGIEHGYFTPDSAEEESVLEKIAAAHPDIIFVALGVPRQEFFIARLRNCLKRGVAIGVGGSFDVISQTLPRAPYWMQRFGIEWLFRLWLEPRRFMRMLGIPIFVLQILRHKWNAES